MGKGKEGVVLSTDRFFNSTNGVADGRYSVLRKRGEIWATSISEGATGRYGSSNRGSESLETSIFEEEMMGTQKCRSYSEGDGLKLHSPVGPGLENIIYKGSDVRVMGQAAEFHINTMPP